MQVSILEHENVNILFCATMKELLNPEDVHLSATFRVILWALSLCRTPQKLKGHRAVFMPVVLILRSSSD